jgi:adenylate kinase
MQFDTIFLIGPQGSGKGTQARLLAEQLGFFYWENGQILRDIAKLGTEFGNKINEIINSGTLLGDDVMLEVVKQKIKEIPIEQGLIFDGLPRRMSQAVFLLPYLREIGHATFVTLFIDLPRTDSLSRLLRRANLEHRADDTEVKINYRLDQYEHDTMPMLDYMRAWTKFITIDGRPPIEEVTKAINIALRSL